MMEDDFGITIEDICNLQKIVSACIADGHLCGTSRETLSSNLRGIPLSSTESSV
jgi:hypothetical protein